MKSILRIMPGVIIFSGLFFNLNAQSLQINELMSSNSGTIYDDDGDTPDWIEIRNTGDSTINLAEYYLSDDGGDKMKWQFPEMNLSPQQYLLVFASGKDRVQAPIYWNTLVDIGESWKYIVPDSELPSTWKLGFYDDSGWSTGASGIGFGDNDDKTVIPSGIMSVFMRTKFSVRNLENVTSMWFNMDFDDGFVAYINGIEIAREGLGEAGSTVAWNQAATSNEAVIYQGKKPMGFDISNYINLLKERNFYSDRASINCLCR